MALTYTLSLGTSQTGLSLRAAIVNQSNVIHLTERDISAGFFEIGAGNYLFAYEPPEDYRGAVVFYTGTLGSDTDFDNVSVKTLADAAPFEYQSGDAYAKTIEILTLLNTSGTPIEVTGLSPDDAGEVEITVGDDYMLEDDRALQKAVITTIPLEDFTVKLFIFKTSLGYYGLLTPDGLDCIVTETDEDTYSIQTELSADVTSLFDRDGVHKFEARTVSPRTITLYTGTILGR